MTDTSAVGPDKGPTSEQRAMADAVSSAIDRPRIGDADDRGAEGYLPTLDLPGFGDARDDCGEEIPHFCDCCGASFSVGRTCAQSVCPRCAPAWVQKRAGSSRENSGGTKDDVDTTTTPGHVAKLDAAARMKSDGTSIKLHHVVFSPPMNAWYLEADDPLQRTFEVIREIFELWDADGYVYYHPWAGDNEDHEGDDRGEWQRRLFNDRDWDDDVRDELIPRGHFHAVIAAEWVPGGDVTRLIHERTGWVIKRIADRNTGRSIDTTDGLDELASAVNYCLSHTGIDTRGKGNNRAAYRAYGSALNGLKYAPKKEEADRAVRRTAPRTLGVSVDSVICEEEVPEGEDSGGDHADVFDDVDGDGDGASATTDADPDDVEFVPCNGSVRVIDEAPAYLNDPEWRATARYVSELREEYEDWESGDGWPG